MKISFAVACLLGYASAAEPVWSLGSVQYHRTDQAIQAAYGDYSTEKANGRPPYQSAVQIAGKDEPVWGLTSVIGHRDDSTTQQGFGNYATDKANERPPYKSTVQMEESESDSESSDDEANVQTQDCRFYPCVIDKKPKYNAWESIKDGAADGKYERLPIAHFSADSDDIFMRSMVKKYAFEKRTPIEQLEDGSTIGGEPTGSFWLSKKDMQYAAKEVLATHKGLSGDKLASYMDTYFDRAWDNFDPNGDGAVEVIKCPMFMRFLASDQGMSLGENGEDAGAIKAFNDLRAKMAA